MKKIITKKSILAVLILLVIGSLAATTGYFYFEYQKIKQNPDLIAKEEVKTITDSIKSFMELPTDEEPTLATITDEEKLKDQEFFKNAQNGDKVLIYTKARKAILYRPKTSRVIEFAPLVLDVGGGEGISETTPSDQTQSATIAIYNGTTTTGLTAEYEKKISGINGLSVATKTNAAKSDYSKTLVIDVSGRNTDLAGQISQLIDGEVVDQIPEGETKPETDILIIAGK